MPVNSVFVSYSHQDRAFVDDLAARLEKHGIAVWYDKSLRGGAVWPQELADQIDRADAVVAVISASFNQSDWTRKEIICAQSKNKPIFPLCRDADPPIWLSDIQYVTTPEELVASLKGARPPRVAAPPTQTKGQELVMEFVELPKDAPPGAPINFFVSVSGTRMRASGVFHPPPDDTILKDIRWYLELYPQ